MIDGLPDSSLLAQTFGRALLVSGAGILAIGTAYAASGRVPRRSRRSGAYPGADQAWLSALDQPVLVREAWCRAAALGVTVLGLAIAAPWVRDHAGELVDRWRAAGSGNESWQYLPFGLIVWVGLLPLALFIWNLPYRNRWNLVFALPGEPVQPTGRQGGPARGQVLVRDDGGRPFTEPVRRACQRHAWGIALFAPASPGNGLADVRRPSLEVLVLLPAVIALFVAATYSAWFVLVAAAAVAGWGAYTYLVTYRAAVASPGSLVADYLLLAARSGGHGGDAARLAERCLDGNPATLQDHEQLVAALAEAVRIGAVPWRPDSVSATNVEMTTRLLLKDGRGREREIDIFFHLRRPRTGDWRITRIVREDPEADLLALRATRFTLASVW